MNLRDVFIKRVNKYQNTIEFTDFINCLNIVEFNLIGKDNEVIYFILFHFILK